MQQASGAQSITERIEQEVLPQAAPGTGQTAANQEAASESDHSLTPVFEVQVERYLPEQLQPAWQVLEDYPLLLVILLLAVGYGLGKLLQALIHKVLARVDSLAHTHAEGKTSRHLSAPIVQTTVTVALVLAVLALEMPEKLELGLVRLLFTLLVIFWARAWFRATDDILATLEAHKERFTLVQPRTAPLFEIGIKLLLVGLFVYLLFFIWNINATAWVASAGIIGIVVGFAAKDTLANLISGVSIVADAPYKLGDYIVLDTGERGIVTHLGIRSTRLLPRDDVEISIPNSVIGAAKITNESGGPWVKHRLRIPVGVAYGSDTDKVVEVLEQIADDNSGVVRDPSPRVRMRAFGESSLDFELLCWIETPEQRGLVTHQLLMEINRKFLAEDIVIPFPQRDVYLHTPAQVPPVSKP